MAVILSLAAACVFAAVWMLSLPPPAVLRLTAALPPGRGRASERPLPVLLGPLRGHAAGWLGRAREALSRGRREAGRRAAVVELCDGLAAELAAGRPPGAALVQAAQGLSAIPAIGGVVDAVRSGDDVPGAFVRASGVPGCDGLRLLAGCWRIGVDRGGMLAAVVEGLAEVLRDEQAHRDDVALQLAGPRATARLLAGLPLLGLVMAVALGARPFVFLLGTLPGVLCLILGSGLDVLGLWWTRRLAVAAEGPR